MLFERTVANANNLKDIQVPDVKLKLIQYKFPFVAFSVVLNYMVSLLYQICNIPFQVQLVKYQARFAIGCFKMEKIYNNSTVLYLFKMMFVTVIFKITYHLFVSERMRAVHRSDLRLQKSCFQ